MLDLSDKYVTPEDKIELRAFTHGLMPRTVPSMLERFAGDWASRGVDAWNSIPNHWTGDTENEFGWWDLPAFLGDAFISPLLGAPQGTCILQPNLHWSMQCVLSSPEIWERGSEIVVTEHAFPSVLHSATSWARMLHKDVKVVRANDKGRITKQALQAAISSRTALFVLSHVGFTTGALRTDDCLYGVAETAHQKNALFMLDGYHAASTMPIHIQELDCDLYAGGLLKEASGSSGNAFLYIKSGLSLTPRLSGWFGDADPFAFNAEPAPHPRVRRRFLGGTTAIAPCYHAVEGLRILLDVGLDAVRKDSLEKTSRCIDGLQGKGINIHSPTNDQIRSAMVILQIDQADKLCQFLKTRGIYTDSRKNQYLRMSPFVWNSTDDIEETVDKITGALRSKDYLQLDLPQQRGPVT